MRNYAVGLTVVAKPVNLSRFAVMKVRSCVGQVERAERVLVVDAGLVCGIVAFQRWCAIDLEGQVSGDGVAALFAEELIQLDAVCNMERYIAVQSRAHVRARKLDLRAAADGNVHVSLMRRAASAAGDNSKITGLHADALRARCGAVHGTACIQIVSCPAPRGLHIVRDREIMPVGIYPADGIGDVLQCEITIQRQRGTGQFILGLTGRADGARYGRQ